MTPATTIQPGGPGAADVVPGMERDAASMIFTADLSRLVRAMRDADLTEDEKKDAREKLGEFLKTPAGVTLLREGVPELLGEMGLKWGIMV